MYNKPLPDSVPTQTAAIMSKPLQSAMPSDLEPLPAPALAPVQAATQAATLDKWNRRFAQASPQQIVDFTFDELLQGPQDLFITSSFGRDSAATLHLFSTQALASSIPVFWLDSTYSTKSTQVHKRVLQERLSLDIQALRPSHSPKRCAIAMASSPINNWLNPLLPSSNRSSSLTCWRAP